MDVGEDSLRCTNVYVNDKDDAGEDSKPGQLLLALSRIWLRDAHLQISTTL